MTFQTLHLPAEPTVSASDGSDVQVLLASHGGSMTHFSLVGGAAARAVLHRSVDEVWFIQAGGGQMWRRHGEREKIVALNAGVCLSIPGGTRFQFRAAAASGVEAIAITMPPWPGEDEAVFIPGPWAATL